MDWRRAWFTTRVFLDLVAIGAISVWFAEPFGWAWRAASAVALGSTWWLVFQLCARFHSGRVDSRVRTGRAARSRLEARATEPVQSTKPVFRKPPKSVRYTWTLTEDGVPVGVEYDRRAVDNWIALGEQHDAIWHKIN